ncbi:MAG: FAD-dependent oxidoreductase [SAR202 cluster bacterium]|nr:FAD-dependent oxidoreductase [Chloroflexota bacterium]MQG39803.1 FAD-dependent oxidoreductase [SAR202 cluster bacterium]
MYKDDGIIIIGGGVIGICTAYYLSSYGQKVTVLDKGKIGHGSSFGNCGLIVPSHSIPIAAPGVVLQGLKWMFDSTSPFYIKPRFNYELIMWLWKFMKACNYRKTQKGIEALVKLTTESMGLYEQIMDANPELDCNFRKDGLLMVYKTAEGYSLGLHESEEVGSHGVQSQRMTNQELQRFEPGLRGDLHGGVYYPDDGHFDPYKFVDQLSKLVKSKGVEIIEDAEVKDLIVSGNRIDKIITPKEEYTPNWTIITAGAWSPNLSKKIGAELPVQPAKGYSVSYNRSGLSIKTPMLLSEAKIGVNPVIDGIRLAGTLELTGIDSSINQRRVQAIVSGAHEYLTGDSAKFEITNVWTGMRPVTPDGLPVIDRIPNIENLIVATGHAMLGMTMGPVTGRAVSEIVAGNSSSIDLTPLKYGRF